LEYGTVTERPAVLPVPHLDFFAAAPLSNGEIILNDAKIVLRIETIAADTIHATVVQGGPLRARKGVTYTVCDYRREDLTAQDRAVYELTHAMEGVRYAISYGRDAHELARYRASLGPVYLIAKVERPTAIVQAAALAKVADELWLCRGDLGAEMGLPAMAQAAHHFSAAVNTIPKPVLLAGQVLEHLAEHWLPTRAEVCALYAALQQGYSGLVLSDETAVGCQPAASCRYAAMFRD
jgi:pyruvate kinase